MSETKNTNLEDQLNGKNTSEDVIKVIENLISVRVFDNGVFCSEGHRAGTDHNHDEQVKVAKVDHKVTEAPHPAWTNYTHYKMQKS